MDRFRAFNKRLSHTRDLIRVVDPLPRDKRQDAELPASRAGVTGARRR